MITFTPVVSAPIPLVFESGPALMWPLLTVLLVAALATVGAGLSASRHTTAQPEGPMRAALPRSREPGERPLAA